ncbi:tbc domain-containing protein [Cystoisospora suis]|uniref:Tbc domain-containing protein n=1 Tax=Cystoisospora suis TaxID=483139 RepID=A0A2C6L139_9APIC|nr:tbc domain-containing protein [Cystoisospora suis]
MYKPPIPSPSSAPSAPTPCCEPSFHQSCRPPLHTVPACSSYTWAVGGASASSLLAVPSRRRSCVVGEALKIVVEPGGRAFTDRRLQNVKSTQRPVISPLAVRYGGGSTRGALECNSEQVGNRAPSSIEAGGGENHTVTRLLTNEVGAKLHPPVSRFVRNLRAVNEIVPSVTGTQPSSLLLRSLASAGVSEPSGEIDRFLQFSSPHRLLATQAAVRRPLTLQPEGGDGRLGFPTVGTEEKRQRSLCGGCSAENSCGDGARLVPVTVASVPRETDKVTKPASPRAVGHSLDTGAKVVDAGSPFAHEEIIPVHEKERRKEDECRDPSFSSSAHLPVFPAFPGFCLPSAFPHSGGAGGGVVGIFAGSMEGNLPAAIEAIDAADAPRKEKASQEGAQDTTADTSRSVLEETCIRERHFVSMTSWPGGRLSTAERNVFKGTMSEREILLESASTGSFGERDVTVHSGTLQQSLTPGPLRDAEGATSLGEKVEQSVDDALEICNCSSRREAYLTLAEEAVGGDIFSSLVTEASPVTPGPDCGMQHRWSFPPRCRTEFPKPEIKSAGDASAEGNNVSGERTVSSSPEISAAVSSVSLPSFPASSAVLVSPACPSLSPQAHSPLPSPRGLPSPENEISSSTCDSHCPSALNRPTFAEGEEEEADVSLPLFAVLSDAPSSPCALSSSGPCSSSRCSSLFSTLPSPSSALVSCTSSSPTHLTPSCSASSSSLQNSTDCLSSAKSPTDSLPTSETMASYRNNCDVATMSCNPANSTFDFAYRIDASRGATVGIPSESFDDAVSSDTIEVATPPVLPAKLRHPEEAYTPESPGASASPVSLEGTLLDVIPLPTFPACPPSLPDNRESVHGKEEEDATSKVRNEHSGKAKNSHEEERGGEACLAEAAPAANLPGLLVTQTLATVRKADKRRDGEKEQETHQGISSCPPCEPHLLGAGEQLSCPDQKDPRSEVGHSGKECADSVKSTEVSSLSTPLSPSPPSVLNSPPPANDSGCSSSTAQPDGEIVDVLKVSPSGTSREPTPTVLRRAGTSLGVSADLPHKTTFPFQEDEGGFNASEVGRRRLSSRSPREHSTEKQQELEAELSKLLCAIEAHTQARRERKTTKGTTCGGERKKESTVEASSKRSDEEGVQAAETEIRTENQGQEVSGETPQGEQITCGRIEERPLHGLWVDKEALVERVRCIVARMDSGISMDLRGRTWKVVLGVEHDGDRDALLSKAVRETALDEPNQRVIRSDVERTRASLAFYRDACNRAWMERLLTCYCKTYHIKYKQGLNELLAPFLYLKDRNGFTVADVFHCFQAFVNRYLSAMFCDDEFTSLQCAFHLFKHLLTYHDPALSEFLGLHSSSTAFGGVYRFTHAENQFVTPELYVTPWFLTLFSSKTSLLVLFALWDKYLVENDQYFFPFIGLALLICFRKDIMKTEVSQLPETLSKITIHSIDQLRQLWSLAKELKSQTPMSFSQRMFASQGLRDAFPQHLQQLESESAFFTFPQEVLDHAYGLNGRPTGGPSKPPSLSLTPRFLSPSSSPFRTARGNTSRPPSGISKLSANSLSDAGVSPPPRLVAPPVHVPPQWKMLILDLRPVWFFESGRLPPAIHIDLMSDWRAAIAALLGVYDPQQHERSFFLSDPRHSSSPSSLNLSGLRHLASLRSSRVKHKTRDLESPPGLYSHGGGRSSVSSTCSPHVYTGSSSSGMLDSSGSQQLLGFVFGPHSSTCGSESGGSGMGVGSPRPRLSRSKGGQERNRGGGSQCPLEQRDGYDRHEGRDDSFSNTISGAKEDSCRRRSSQQHGAAVATVAHGNEGCDGRQSQVERHEENSPTRVSVVAAGGGERVREKGTEDATPSVMLPHSRPSRSGGGGGASRLLRGFRRRTQQILGPPSYLISSSSLSAPSREGSGEICSAYQEESFLCTPASESDNLTLLGRKERAHGSRRGSSERSGEDQVTGEQIQRVPLSLGRQGNSSLYTRRTYPSVRSSRTRRLTALPHYRDKSVSTPSLGTRWPCPVQNEISLVWDDFWKDQIGKTEEAEGERGSEEVSDFDDDYFSDDPALYRISPSTGGASHFWEQPESVSSASLDSRTTVTPLEAWRSLEKRSEKTQEEHHREEAPGADGKGTERAGEARREEEEAGTGKKKRMWGFRSKGSVSREKGHGEKHTDTKGTRKERETTSRSVLDLEKGTALSLDVRRQKGSQRGWSSHASSETGENTWTSPGTRRRSKRSESHFSEVCVLAQGSSARRRSGRLGTPEERRLHTRRKLAALRSNSHRHGLLHSDCKEKCRHAFSEFYGKIKDDDSSVRCSNSSSSSFAAPCCVCYRKCFSDGDVPPLKYLKCFKSAAHSHSTSSRDLSISRNNGSLPSSPPTGRCNEEGQSLVVQVSACEATSDPDSSCASQVSTSWIGVPVGGRPYENGFHPEARKSPLSGELGGAPRVKSHSLDPSRASSPDVNGSRRGSSGKEERSGSESAYGSPAVTSHDSNALSKRISPKCSPLTQLLKEEARLAREQKGEAVDLAEDSSSSTGTADEDEDQSVETESDSRKRLRGSGEDGEGHSHGRSSQFFLSSLMLGAGTTSPRFFYSRGLSPDENAKAFKEEKVQIPSHHVCLITADEKSYQDAMEVYRVLTQEMDVRWVSIAKGGYRACHDLALQEGLELVDHNPSTCPICADDGSADNGNGGHSRHGTDSRSSSSARGSRSSSVSSSLSSPVMDMRSTSRLSSPTFASGASGSTSGFLGAVGRHGSNSGSSSSRPVSSKRGGTSLSSLLPIRVGLSSSSPRSTSPQTAQLLHSGGDTSGSSVSGRSQALCKLAQNDSPAGGCLGFQQGNGNGGTYDAGLCTGAEGGWEDKEAGVQGFCPSPQSGLSSESSKGTTGAQNKTSQRELSTVVGSQKQDASYNASWTSSSAASSSSSFSQGGGGSSGGGGGMGFGGILGAWRRLSNATARNPHVSNTDSPHLSTGSSSTSGGGGGTLCLSGEGEPRGKDRVASVVCYDAASLYCGGVGQNSGWPVCPHPGEGPTPVGCPFLAEVATTASGGGSGHRTLPVSHFSSVPGGLTSVSELPPVISYTSPQSAFFLPPFCPQCHCSLPSVGPPVPGAYPPIQLVSSTTTSSSSSRRSRSFFPATSLSTHSLPSSSALHKGKSRHIQPSPSPVSNCPQCGTAVVPWCCSAHSNTVVTGAPPLSASDLRQPPSENRGRSGGSAGTSPEGGNALPESCNFPAVTQRRRPSTSSPKGNSTSWDERGHSPMMMPSPYASAPLLRSGTLAHIPTLAVSLYYLSWRDLLTSPHTEQLRSFHCYIEGVLQPSPELLTHARQIVKRRDLRRCRLTIEDGWSSEQSGAENKMLEGQAEGGDSGGVGASVNDQGGPSSTCREQEDESASPGSAVVDEGSLAQQKSENSRKPSAETRSGSRNDADKQGANEAEPTSEVKEASGATGEEESSADEDDSPDDGTEYFFCSIAPHEETFSSSAASSSSKHGKLSLSGSSSAASSSSVSSDRSCVGSHTGGCTSSSAVNTSSRSRSSTGDSSSQHGKKRGGEAEAHSVSGSGISLGRKSSVPSVRLTSGGSEKGGSSSFRMRSGSSAVAGQFIAAGLGEQYSYLQEWHMNRPTLSSCRILVTPGRLLTVSAPVPMLVRRGTVDAGRSQPESGGGESDDTDGSNADGELEEDDEEDEEADGAAETFMVDDSRVIRGREVDRFAGLVPEKGGGGGSAEERNASERKDNLEAERKPESCARSEEDDDDDEGHLEEVVRVYASFELSEILKITSKKNNTKLLCFYFNANKTQPLMVLRFESAPAAHDCIEHVRGMYRILKMQKQSQKTSK